MMMLRSASSWMSIALFVLLAGATAHAEPGAIVTVGEAPEASRATVHQAIASTLRDGGWSEPPAPLTAKEAGAIGRCLRDAEPWRCVLKLTSGKQIQRVAVVSVDPQRTSDGLDMIVLTARVVVAGSNSVIPLQRFCSRCTDDNLRRLANELAAEAIERIELRGSHTVLAIKTTPQGALAFVDDRPVGATDTAIDIVPGTHKVRVEKVGFVSETRTVDAAKGTTSEVSVTLKTDGTGARPPQPPTRPCAERSPGVAATSGDPCGPTQPPPAPPSRLLPAIGVGVGAVAVGVGIALLLSDEDPAGLGEPAKREYTDTKVPGIATIAGGAVVAGASGFLLWKFRKQRSQPTIAATPGGVVFGVTHAF